ncbi:MAG: putative GNAT family N-acyltransferase [Myxococcota bacterium]|jgi:predicted GNAT family N-acyltransferase
MRVREARAEELAACIAVRHEVFVVGQGVPVEIEQDGRDSECRHAIVVEAGQVLGTARLRVTEIGEAKAERVAVRSTARGRGLGRLLMEALEGLAREADHSALVLHAQADVIGFYEHIGYVAEGERFFEADIEHLSMRRDLA